METDEMATRSQFVNNYCADYSNLKVTEDQYANAKGQPSGFTSDTNLSKALSYTLRHGSKRQGFKMFPGGFIEVEAILNHRDYRGRCTEDDIKRIVAQDKKGRYYLRNEPHTGKLQIRANQGHTIQVKDDGTLLQPITPESGITEIVHGTTQWAWTKIRQEGLSRMKRNHIHFLPEMPEANDERLPGYRGKSCILIVVDINKATFDGIQFFRSRNNVILSPGDPKGMIKPKYFKKVININTGENLLQPEGPSKKKA